MNAKNLKSLHLQRNPIDDISPLEELTNLERLYLLANHISDISPLENLTNLEELHLYDNRISDISLIFIKIVHMSMFISVFSVFVHENAH